MAMAFYKGEQELVRIISVTTHSVVMEDAGGNRMEIMFSPPERQKIVAGFSK